MKVTDNFRKQHVEILETVNEILGSMDATSLEKDATKIRHLLSKIAGKINVHLAMEDKSLYPKMINHDSEKVRKIAKTYMNEMSNINQKFKNYISKWPNPMVIQADSRAFIRETREIFAALQRRIERENVELYPLLE